MTLGYEVRFGRDDRNRDASSFPPISERPAILCWADRQVVLLHIPVTICALPELTAFSSQGVPSTFGYTLELQLTDATMASVSTRNGHLM